MTKEEFFRYKYLIPITLSPFKDIDDMRDDLLSMGKMKLLEVIDRSKKYPIRNIEGYIARTLRRYFSEEIKKMRSYWPWAKDKPTTVEFDEENFTYISSNDVFEEVVRRLLNEELSKALNIITNTQRKIIIFRYILGYQLKEIMKKVDRPKVQSVQGSEKRALKRLKKRYNYLKEYL
jgi:RNA polymerase sigma factor (sigma-70 family)